jgi:hypothetical protein
MWAWIYRDNLENHLKLTDQRGRRMVPKTDYFRTSISHWLIAPIPRNAAVFWLTSMTKSSSSESTIFARSSRTCLGARGNGLENLGVQRQAKDLSFEAPVDDCCRGYRIIRTWSYHCGVARAK